MRFLFRQNFHLIAINSQRKKVPTGELLKEQINGRGGAWKTLTVWFQNK
jgi:hypothetical protein